MCVCVCRLCNDTLSLFPSFTVCPLVVGLHLYVDDAVCDIGCQCSVWHCLLVRSVYKGVDTERVIYSVFFPQ